MIICLSLLLCLLHVPQQLCSGLPVSESHGDGITATHTKQSAVEWLKIHWYAVLLVIGVIMVGVSVGANCLVCWRCWKRRSRDDKDDVEMEELLPRKGQEEDPRSPTSIKKLTEERTKDEKNEKENSLLAVDYVLRKTGLYVMSHHLPDMGSRMQKYWFEVALSESESTCTQRMVLTIAPIPRHCPLLVDSRALKDKTVKETTVQTLNELFGVVKVHPFLQPIDYVHYLPDRKQVIIVQRFRKQGSLKDIIYKVKPDLNWSKKYPVGEFRGLFRSKAGLPPDKVALYGRQILEAMIFLSEKFRVGGPLFLLGHIQSGNIFVGEDGVCRVGGYENTLLGYRSRFYRMCKNYMEHMDVIMFGHLVFEMSCGYELTSLTPTEKHYDSIEHEPLRDVLHFIFSHDLSNKINNIVKHKFFQSEDVTMQLGEFDHKKVKLTKAMKSLLKKVTRDTLVELELKHIVVD